MTAQPCRIKWCCGMALDASVFCGVHAEHESWRPKDGNPFASDHELTCDSCDGTRRCSSCDGTGQCTCGECGDQHGCSQCNGDGKCVDCKRLPGTKTTTEEKWREAYIRFAFNAGAWVPPDLYRSYAELE